MSSAENNLPAQLREWADLNMRTSKYGPGMLRIAADVLESQAARIAELERINLEWRQSHGEISGRLHALQDAQPPEGSHQADYAAALREIAKGPHHSLPNDECAAWAMQIATDALSLPPMSARSGEQHAPHSPAHKAAIMALAVKDSVSYPSSVAAKQIRSTLRDLLLEYERLHIIHAATCAAYCREHERSALTKTATAKCGQCGEVLDENGMCQAMRDRKAELMRKSTSASFDANGSPVVSEREIAGEPNESRLEQALQQVMERLADLLDADQFNSISTLVREAGVRYPAVTVSPVMAMLPNDHHPGPRCSCAECLRRYPDEKASTLADGCTRSHPHEDMDSECEKLTEIAREDNRRAHEKGEKRPHSAWYFTVGGGYVCRTCGSHAESPAAILATEADCTRRCVSSLVKPDSFPRPSPETNEPLFCCEKYQNLVCNGTCKETETGWSHG
jgi:hypothetical protein